MSITVQIDGVGKVQMDDSFKSLSPADQQATVDEIANHPTAQQAAPPKTSQTFGDNVQGALSGIDLGVNDLPASIVGLIPRATDFVGLTKSAYPTFKASVQRMNHATNPNAFNGSTGAKIGRVVGQVIGTAPLAALTPFGAGGIAGDIGNSALQGATAAIGTSDTSDAPLWKQGAIGALGGGLIGGTLGMVGRGIARTITPNLSPEDQALGYVRNLMGSSTTAPDASGLRAAQAGANGKPMLSAEAIGRPAEVAIGALARRHGATADKLAGEMAARTAGAPARILDDYATAAGIHPAAAQGNLDAFVEANQAKAAPLYDAAYKANQNISSPMIDRVLDTPAGRKALASARNMMQNDMSTMGVADPDLLEQAQEAGQEIPWKGGIASGLKLRSLDYVKRALDDQIGSALRNGNKNEAAILIGQKKKLVNAMDDADITAAAGPHSTKPEGGLYAQARAAAGDYLGAQEQFANGQDFILNPKVTPKQMADHVYGLGDADAEAFKGGVANRLFNTAQNGKLNPKIFSSPSIQQKLAVVIGPSNAKTFLTNVSKEANMANFARTRMPGAGSPTAEYAAEMLSQDGNSKIPAALDFGVNAARHGITSAALGAVANTAKNAAATYATRGMPVLVRDAAGRFLMLPPADLANVLDSTGATGLIGGARLSARGVLASAIRRNVNQVAPRAGILALPALSTVGLQ